MNTSVNENPYSLTKESETFNSGGHPASAVVPELKSNAVVLDEILGFQEPEVPEAVFKIAERFFTVKTNVGEYLVERSIFSIGLNYIADKCLIVDIEDGISDEAKLYIDFDTVKCLTGLTHVRGKDALRFTDHNYEALKKMVADLNKANIKEPKRICAYSKSAYAYEGSSRYRHYIYERARS